MILRYYWPLVVICYSLNISNSYEWLEILPFWRLGLSITSLSELWGPQYSQSVHAHSSSSQGVGVCLLFSSLSHLHLFILNDTGFALKTSHYFCANSSDCCVKFVLTVLPRVFQPSCLQTTGQFSLLYITIFYFLKSFPFTIAIHVQISLFIEFDFEEAYMWNTSLPSRMMICRFCFSYLSCRCERATYPPSVLRPVTLHWDDNMGAEVLHPHRQPVGVAQQGEGGEMDVTEKNDFPFLTIPEIT